MAGPGWFGVRGGHELVARPDHGVSGRGLSSGYELWRHALVGAAAVLRRTRLRAAVMRPRSAVLPLGVGLLAAVVGCGGPEMPTASDDVVTTLPIPANIPATPLPSDVPPIELPSAVPEVQLPSDVPEVGLPSDVPRVGLPAEIPDIPLPSSIPLITCP